MAPDRTAQSPDERRRRRCSGREVRHLLPPAQVIAAQAMSEEQGRPAARDLVVEISERALQSTDGAGRRGVGTHRGPLFKRRTGRQPDRRVFGDVAHEPAGSPASKLATGCGSRTGRPRDRARPSNRPVMGPPAGRQSAVTRLATSAGWLPASGNTALAVISSSARSIAVTRVSASRPALALA